jgi:hypothetical protein
VIKPFQTVDIDLNHDGVSDFALGAYSFSHVGSGFLTFLGNMSVSGRNPANAVVTTAKGFAAALHAGALVGPGKRVKAGNQLMAKCSHRSNIFTTHTVNIAQGPWLNLSHGYLGLKFKVNGKIHYGWARLTGTVCAGGTLTGYAYETIPDKPIIAGKTKGTDDDSVEESNRALTAPAFSAPIRRLTTLGLLALGAPGLSIWRREGSTNETQ